MVRITFAISKLTLSQIHFVSSTFFGVASFGLVDFCCRIKLHTIHKLALIGVIARSGVGSNTRRVHFFCTEHRAPSYDNASETYVYLWSL